MESIKKRTLRVLNMSCGECEEKIRKSLAAMHGIKSVEADHLSGKLLIAYDVMESNLATIEKKVEECGYYLNRGFVQRMKKNIIHFLEENERDNLRTKPAACCSNPDEILNKAGKL